jgi:exopolysaccharide biosynthesis polyprenyl glycosylphosphotransferase
MTLMVNSDRDAVRETERTGLPWRSRVARVVGIIFAIDAAAILVATVLGWILRNEVDSLAPAAPTTALHSNLLPVVVAAWLIGLAVSGSYRRTAIGAGFDEFRHVSTGTFMALGLIASIAFLTRSSLSRGFLLSSFVVGLPLLLLMRYVVRKTIHRLRSRGHLRGRVVAVCSPSGLSELMTTLERLDHIGYTIVGTVIPGDDAYRALDLPVPLYGGIDALASACDELSADTVIVAGGGFMTSTALRRVGWELEGKDVDLVLMPSLIDVAGPRISYRHMGGIPLVYVDAPHADRASGLAKRIFDLVVTSLLVLCFSPLMLGIAGLVKLQDRGPIFFRQQRSGRNGELFWMTKFRSMIVDADKRLDELIDFNDAGDVLFKMRNDPRVTRVGRFIRRYSLDELPQLFDVLRGDMSLVGPRPPLPREVEQYPVDMHRRLLVRPGLTGLWQVSGRSNLTFEDAVRLDLSYVDNWSITGDLIIILKTVRAVLFGSGAY